MKCSPTTLLRLVRQSPLPSSAHVRVVGVDEWAWRRGQRYGTLLVDLEKRIPIDLLADATAESFAAGFKFILLLKLSVETVERPMLMEQPEVPHRLFRLPIAGISSTLSVKPWSRCWRDIMPT